jgi:ABC-type multidrug transport system ATPase subunit
VVIVARGLSLDGVFPEVDLEFERGLAVVAGPAGSGRTSLLLTLTGRMRPSGGTLLVAGHTRPRAIRRAAALALIDGVTDLDRSLTVREHLRERRRGPYGEALERAGLAVAERTRAGDLDREQHVRLGLALALLDRPLVIAADNVDTGLPADRREAVWDLLAGIAADGPAVLASCVQAPARRDALVELV